jgi:hypothetical protein
MLDEFEAKVFDVQEKAAGHFRRKSLERPSEATVLQIRARASSMKAIRQ